MARTHVTSSTAALAGPTGGRPNPDPLLPLCSRGDQAFQSCVALGGRLFRAVEFDSLSDVVSFGLAPSFLVYTIGLGQQETLGMLISAMPMVFGALRLARFNVQLVGYDKDYFKGLPIPSVAITIAAFVITYYLPGAGLKGIYASLLPPMVAVLSLLMLSSIKYDTAPKFSRHDIKRHPLRFTVAIIGVSAVVFTRGAALFPFFMFYILTGPLRYIVQFIQHSLHPKDKTVNDEESEMTSVDV